MDELQQYALAVVLDELDDGIEFSNVYERDDLEGRPQEDLETIHDKALVVMNDLRIQVMRMMA